MIMGVELAFLLAAPAFAEHNIFPMPRLGECRLAGSTTVTRLDDLPEAVRSTLNTLVPDGIAEAGGPFNATDVWVGQPPYPRRRFIRAYRHGRRWVIWYEAGGRGHDLHAVGVIPGRAEAQMSYSGPYSSTDGRQLCAASRVYFGGAASSGD